MHADLPSNGQVCNNVCLPQGCFETRLTSYQIQVWQQAACACSNEDLLGICILGFVYPQEQNRREQMQNCLVYMGISSALSFTCIMVSSWNWVCTCNLVKISLDMLKWRFNGFQETEEPALAGELIAWASSTLTSELQSLGNHQFTQSSICILHGW